jgi:multicomponent Na+:H+ antiporter subunit B
MNPLILRFAARATKPVLIAFSAYLLMKGHNEPGGGFVGGLVASSAYLLHIIAFDVKSAREELAVGPHVLLGAGLLIAVTSGLAPLALGLPFFDGLWFKIPIWPWGDVKIGTPVFFDLGVYLVVLGTMLMTFFNLKERP